MKALPITALLMCLLALSSCEPTAVKPSPPPGSFVFGTASNEVGTDILELSDGNFLLLGGAQDEQDGDYDITFTKVDPNGGEMWTKAVREEGEEEYGRYIRKIPGGYVVLGLRSDNPNYNNSSIILHWFDEDLNETRSRVLGNPAGGYNNNELASDLIVMDNGGFLIPSSSYNGLYLIRLDEDGQQLEPLVVANNNYNTPTNFLVQKENGGYLMAVMEGYDYIRDLTLYHLDSTAQIITLHEAVGNTVTTSGTEIKGIHIHEDGSYYIAFSEFDRNPSIIQMDSTGNVLREISLGNTGTFGNIWPWENGSLLLASGDPGPYSYDASDAYVGVLDSTGNFDLTASFGGEDSEKIRSTQLGSNGILYLLGQTQSYGAGGTDMYLIITQP